MKRLVYLLGILLIALCLFASAYGERSQRPKAQPAMTTEQQEAEMIRAKLDQLTVRMNHLKSDMAALKLAVVEPGNGNRVR